MGFFRLTRIILECDANIVASRVTKTLDDGSTSLSDQTLSQVWRMAQQQIKNSFLQ
jgi:hypothetical protein